MHAEVVAVLLGMNRAAATETKVPFAASDLSFGKVV